MKNNDLPRSVLKWCPSGCGNKLYHDRKNKRKNFRCLVCNKCFSGKELFDFWSGGK